MSSSNIAQKELQSNWLIKYAKNITSQYGEDGVIGKALEILGESDKWCVEFGSWDGKVCSNTYNLITAKDYNAVHIEASDKRFKDLQNTFAGNDKVHMFNSFVGFNQHDSLNTILVNTPIPNNFDFLSIDIDGNDYHVWDAFKNYKPKLVIIEFNPTVPPNLEFVQPKDISVTQGTSLLSMAKLGKEKGYELVATTTNNALFVDEKYFDRFEIKDNSVEKMMTDRSYITQMFCGYDGHVFLRGFKKMPLQQIEIKESRVQQLPKWARKVVGDRNVIRRKFGKYFRRLRKKDIL
jgi:hypothetical protein